MHIGGRRPRLWGGKAALALAALALSGPPGGLAAQEDCDCWDEHEGEYRHERRHRHGPPRWDLGGGFAIAVPQGELAQFIDEGFGLAAHATYGLDRQSIVGLRFEAGFVQYGSERFTTPLLPATGRILVDVKTRNNIGMLGLGPQLQVPEGPIRPYLNGFVGLGYFFTESSVGGSDNFEFDDFARTVNFDDVSFAWGGGGGLGVRLGNGFRPIYLNFEAQYRNHGETEYLREGSIVDDGFGGILITPLRSEADFLLFQLGVSIGL